jgi:hypothetical protein
LTTKICVFSVSTIYSITALQDIEESLALAKRFGVQVVVGVGSGAAIDVAKSVANILADDGSNDVELILSPATLGGCIASTSDEPLLLSTEEEALLPLGSASESWNGSMQQVSPTILIDEKDLDDATSDYSTTLKLSPHLSHGVIASLVIALDAAFFNHRRDLPCCAEYNDIINKTIDHALQALGQQHGSDNATTGSESVDRNFSSRKRHAVSAALYSGKLLNLGNQHFRRSAPISIASALLPPFFPHGNILTYVASMLPGLCATIDYHDSTFQNRDNNNCLEQLNAASRLTEGKYWNDLTEWANEISTFYEIPSMASLAEGAPATSTLLDRMDSNQVLLNVTDSEDIDYLGEILQRSLNR